MIQNSKPFTATSDLKSYTHSVCLSLIQFSGFWICLSNDKNGWNVGAKSGTSDNFIVYLSQNKMKITCLLAQLISSLYIVFCIHNNILMHLVKSTLISISLPLHGDWWCVIEISNRTKEKQNKYILSDFFFLGIYFGMRHRCNRALGNNHTLYTTNNSHSDGFHLNK